MSPIDWTVIVIYCLLVLAIGFYFTRQGSKSPEDYFIGGRKMPWWLIGLSDVSSYGASSAPWVMLFFLGGFLEYWLVAWVSWCIWMPLVAVIWAKMWRRLGVVTTVEFVEQRYSGKPASVYRAAYAVYAYFAWAVVIMANMAIWFTQAISPVLGWSPSKVLLIFGIIAIVYTLLSGFLGVVYTELIQFAIIMIGAFIFMIIAINAAGGLDAVYAKVIATRGADFLQPLPTGQRISSITLLALVAQGLFFAGSPFAGEGWTAQRAMSARNETHAILGQMLNSLLSLVIRLIPAVFIGLAAVAIYSSESVEVPATIWATTVRDYAPVGLLGLLVAGVIAAFMAGVSSTTNWGCSYLLNDVYRRYLRKDASTREYIFVSRLLTFGTLALAYVLGLSIDPKKLDSWVLFTNSALIVFSLPLAWLKWFWWRLNAFGDAVGTIGAFPIAFLVWFGSDAVLPASFRSWAQHSLGWNLNGLVPDFGNLNKYPFWYGFGILFVSGWIVILLVTFLTRPEKSETLRAFYVKVRPMGLWGPIARSEPEVSQAVATETRADLWASLWGVLFCFSIVIGFFGLAARYMALGTSFSLISIGAGYLFWRTAMKARTVQAEESSVVGVEADRPLLSAENP